MIDGLIRGWIAIVALWVLPFLLLRYTSPGKYRSGTVYWAACLGIFAHHAFSVANYLFGPFFFTSLDPHMLNNLASTIADFPDAIAWSVGSQFYVKWLAIFYHLLGADTFVWDGPQMYVGQTLTVSVFLITTVVLLWFLEWLDVRNSLTVTCAVLAWALFPAELIYGSVTAREAFMTLALMLAVASFWWLFASNRLRFFWFGAFCLCVMGLFHQIMLIYALVATMAVGLLWLFQSQLLTARTKLLCLIAVFLAALLLFAGLLYLPVAQNEYYVDMLKGSWVDAIRVYRGWVNSAAPNTQYLLEGEFVGWFSAAGGLLLSYAFYLLGPFHGDLGSISTWVLLVQALVRWFGIPMMLILCARDKRCLLLGLIYFSLSFTWSVGTTNHGQAFRHHMMTDWLLILSTAVYFVRFKPFNFVRRE
ncbi:MAG: hypothetical protein HOM55_06780 [Proteobacteria bacterium]|nr:hypothetical protein [Pseudomonadota bacterium]